MALASAITEERVTPGGQPLGVADYCVHFEAALDMRHVREKSYVVHSSSDGALACVELRARKAVDWWFARRWVPVYGSHRPLYRLLDEVEARGFRFRVSGNTRKQGVSGTGHVVGMPEPPWVKASQLVDGLAEDERAIHAELFPEEAELLKRGYDWDPENVYVHDVPLGRDPHGRVLERDEDMLYEWAWSDDDYTWRRFPLERVRLGLMVPRT